MAQICPRHSVNSHSLNSHSLNSYSHQQKCSRPSWRSSCSSQLQTPPLSVDTSLYSGSGCSGNPTESIKSTLGDCFYLDGESCKLSLSGGTYSFGQYETASCLSLTSNVSPNPVTGASATCIDFSSGSTQASIKVLSTSSSYESSATAWYDCTSGIAYQNCALEGPPTSAPTPASGGCCDYSDADCDLY